MTDGWVGYLTGPWGFAFAFAAGVLSFLSPCVLPLVPAYLAHMTGTAAVDSRSGDQRRETMTHALAFVLGFGIVFTLLGASVGLLAATLGSDDQYFVRDHEDVLAKIAGVVLIVMGLNLVGVIKVPWLYRTYSFDAFSSPQLAAAGAAAGGGTATVAMGGGGWGGMRYAKSMGVGAAFAVGWVPCIGPVLGAIFGLAAEAGDVAKGAYLLMVYSLGLGVPFLITGMAVVPVTSFLRRYRPVLPLVEILMGTLVIFVGALIFLNELTVFNRYFDFFGFSQI